MGSKSVIVVGLAIFMASAAAFADVAWNGTIALINKKATIVLTRGADAVPDTVSIGEEKITVSLSCQDPIKPVDVTLVLVLPGGVPEVSAGVQVVGQKITFVVDGQTATSTGSFLVFRFKGEDVRRIAVLRGSSTDASTGTPTDTPANPPRSSDSSLALLLSKSTELAMNYDDFPKGNYSRDGNEATFTITPDGTVLDRPSEQVDEDDAVTVIVVGSPILLANLTVRRKSAVRQVGGLRIVGANLQVPSDSFRLRSFKPDQTATLRAELGDFAPGVGVVEIVARTNQGNEVVGEFDFSVSPLYSGAFSLGAVWTSVEQKAFGVVAKGSSSVVTETEDGDGDLLYALFYTHYVWGKRDLEKTSENQLMDLLKVNPTVGIVLNDVAANGLAGISTDLFNAFVITAGVHAAHVSEIDPQSGLSLGDPAPADGTVPTTKTWKTGFFWGVSLDLRAALQLLGAIGSSTGG